MAEEFQGGVCGDTWWNPNQFYGAGSAFSTPCSVATQLGGGSGGYDMGNLGWSQEIIKDMQNNSNIINNINNNNLVCDDYNYNSLAFSANFDSTFDILGFGLSPTSSTTIWNEQNQLCNIEANEEKFNNPMIEDINLSTTMQNSYNFPNQDGSSPNTTMTTSSNTTSGDSSTTTYEDGLTTSFPINSTASYLIQTLFNDDVDDQSQLLNTNDYGGGEFMDNNAFIRPPLTPPFTGLELPQSEQTRAPSSIVKSLKCSPYPTKLVDLKHEEIQQERKKKTINNEQSIAKRPRIETPSPLPTFKVRKEKLGDRITALQQLVSPFGKTDTASVLQEAIEYIKFLHDQVHVSVKGNDNEAFKQDLRSRGLCVVPITSTYPVTQETSVDFWTPTFG